MNADVTKEDGTTPKRAKTRPKRTPLHERDILTVRNKNPEREYRWVNDVDDRLFRFTEAGWEFTTDKGVEVGDPTVNADKEVGTVVTKSRGSTKSYLMSIPKEWYEEDQRVKASRVDELEASMYEQLNSRSDGRYGKAKRENLDKI